MSTHKHFDKICCGIIIFTLLITALLMNVDVPESSGEPVMMEYENKIFDTSKVHEIDITMENWEEFLEDCQNEEYYVCDISIDGEIFENIAIRGKGNTSLTMVESYGNDRYSFKIEFDHYDEANTYYGLDKLCLNNIIQDNTYMKDYLTYQLMAEMGVAAPLCSYVYITVNGEDWGLYLAVEGIEASFLERNYGEDYGDLYKPDSMSMGGGRGNGAGFDMDEFMENSDSQTMPENNESSQQNNQGQMPGSEMPGDGAAGGEMSGGGFPGGEMPEGMEGGQGGQRPGGEMPEDMEMPEGIENGQMPGGEMPGGMMPGGTENSDVLLQYIDDQVDSYANIFDNAKTTATNSDKNRLIQSLENLSNGEDIENTVDVDTVIQYFVVHNFVLNFDSYTGSMVHNYYLYEEDGQMEMIPWDYNLAFGGFDSAGGATDLVNYPIDSPVSGGDVSERPMIAWIFEDEEYTEMYHQYFDEFISNYFENGYFEVMVEEVSSMIAPYVEKDPTKFCTYEEFETGVDTLKEFCLLRAESIRGQLDGTIGSTNETQQKEDLINADHLNVQDMGTMNNAMGGRGDFEH